MGTLGTFDSFTTAKLGIYAAQHGLKVTGNNISNINTTGYTRQRIDQVSFKTGVYDRYKSMMDNHIGSGALVTGISQIRDPYLDIRFRNTSSDVGYYDTKLSGLQEIASILDEVGKGEEEGDGILYAQLQDLAEKLRAFSSDPSVDNDTLVRKSAEALTSLFNKYAGRLEQLQKDTEESFSKNVTEINKILTNIQGLNKSIRECEINGDNALEMRDQRNLEIDKLSEYMHIRVVYSMEDVGAGIQVEKLSIFLGDSNPDPNVETDTSMLVDGLYVTQLSVPDQKPVLNTYDNDYLKGYLYLKEASANSDEIQDLLNAGTALGDLIPALDENGDPKQDDDGNQLYLVGTNDAAAKGIVTEENDNFTIQLGKLLDTHGKEWENTTTDWEQVGSAAVNAVYTYGITSTGAWADGDQLVIAGTTYTVGQDDFTLAVANNSASLAAFIAGKLPADADYDIKANGANIVYTAKTPGAINGDGPAREPSLTLNATPNANVTLGNMQNPTPGADATNVDTSDAGTTVDEFGTEKTIVYAEMNGGMYKITVTTEHTREIALDDNDLYGSLQAQRELLTEEGEFSSSKDVLIDENAMIKRGIPFYRQGFDLLAQKFAEAYNELNTGYKIDQNGNYLDKDNNVIAGLELAGLPVNRYEPLTKEQEAELIAGDCYKMDENGDPVLDKDGNKIADLDRWLVAKGAVAMGGPLFSNSGAGDDTSSITAANINVSHSWSNGSVLLVPKFEVLFSSGDGDDGLNHSTQNINANHMVSMIDQALNYNPADLHGSDAEGPLMFSGSFNDMFSYLMGVEANDAKVTNIKLTSSYTTYVELDSSREGVSGVDLNDEAMNMMQYQKAYSAACRLMTVIDSMLDRLINNTGVTV